MARNHYQDLEPAFVQKSPGRAAYGVSLLYDGSGALKHLVSETLSGIHA